MDELDTQLANDLAAQEAESEPIKEAKEIQVEPVKEPEVKEEIKPEPKMFDEEYVKGLRKEAAKYRRELRDEQQRNAQPVQPNVQGYQEYPNPQSQPAPTGQFYDPRVDDMLLDNKINEIKADPKFSDLFEGTDEEGFTFKEKLLQEALDQQWPISNLRALVWEMKGDEIVNRTKQKGIDEAYKSMNAKAQAAPERNVSSGKAVETTKIDTFEDAMELTKKELGITDLSEVELR